MNKNFATLPPSPTRLSPSKEIHASLQIASRISEAHTATHMPLKARYNTPFVLGDGRGSGVTHRLSRCMRGARAQDSNTTPQLLQTRDWHLEGKSIKFVSVIGVGEKKKKISFLCFRALTCWGGPQVLLSASHHHSQQSGEKWTFLCPIHSGTRAKAMLESGTAVRGTT